MKNILELASILSLFVFLGAVFWIGFGLIGTSSEAGDGSLMSWEKSRGALTVAALSMAVNLATGYLRKRLDR